MILASLADAGTHLTRHDRREALQFIHLDEVLEGAWRKEKRLPLLQLHGRGEFRFVVVVAKVRDLVQGTAGGGAQHTDYDLTL